MQDVIALKAAKMSHGAFDSMCSSFSARLDELREITHLRLEGTYGKRGGHEKCVKSLRNCISKLLLCRFFCGDVLIRAERLGGGESDMLCDVLSTLDGYVDRLAGEYALNLNAAVLQTTVSQLELKLQAIQQFLAREKADLPKVSHHHQSW